MEFGLVCEYQKGSDLMAVIESAEKSNYIHYIKLTWTTPATATTVTHTTAKWITGLVDRVAVVPATSATPASGFSVTLTDNDGIDILKGGGSSCPATGTTDLYPSYPINSDLDLAIASAGTNRAGYVKIFWREGND